jgi:glycerophosphoryl diester phosphodiesterase
MTRRFVHRGTIMGLPANSAEGLRRVLELDYDGVEIDVQISADGVLYATHDRYITIAGQRRRLNTVLSSEIDSSDTHADLSPLADLLAILRNSNVAIILDLKARGSAEVLAPMLEEADRHRVTVISFLRPEVAAFRRLRPDIDVGIIVGFTREVRTVSGFIRSLNGLFHPIRAAVSEGATIAAVPTWRITEGLIRAARRAGVAVYAWSAKALVAVPAGLDVEAVILDVTSG